MLTNLSLGASDGGDQGGDADFVVGQDPQQVQPARGAQQPEVPATATAAEALRALRAATGMQAEALIVTFTHDANLSALGAMADYNLLLLPVLDSDDHLIGVLTIDDILEATIPADWRRRRG